VYLIPGSSAWGNGLDLIWSKYRKHGVLRIGIVLDTRISGMGCMCVGVLVQRIGGTGKYPA
jgi:hypothetical protein